MNYPVGDITLEDLEKSIDTLIYLYNLNVNGLNRTVSMYTREILNGETDSLRTAMITLSHVYTERSYSMYKDKMNREWKNISIVFDRSKRAEKQTQ